MLQNNHQYPSLEAAAESFKPGGTNAHQRPPVAEKQYCMY